MISVITTLKLLCLTFIIDLIVCQQPSDINRDKPNEVDRVDLQINENVIRHHTNQYKQMGLSPYSPIGASLVLRRGEVFNMILHLRDEYNSTNDKIRLELSFGSSPQLDKGTLMYLPISFESNTQTTEVNRWDAKLVNERDQKLHIQLLIPANAPIGIWRIKFSIKLAGTKDLKTFSVRESIYVIFNTWCKDDTVYMDREDARQEYVLNEVGKVYMGTYNAPTGTTWTYGQFNEYVLPGMMMLLDRSRLTLTARSDVVKISRAISAMMNSHDDNGLLVGNWSGNYLDGVSPWQWSGSASIFERYYKSGGRPVKFGQCWVFGGLTTTALRTLGIPARTISNFISAHDTDLSLTVDQFSSERGEKMNGVNGDSIWNFHCWSDAWMVREDLPPTYSGWQAIDATPQETSNGSYQLGPASLEAIKQGKVKYAYDVAFVYSEVNADVVTWRLDRRSPYQWRRVGVQTDHVGRKILTKRIGYMDGRRYGVSDAEDITDQYKYPEKSIEERESYNEAYRSAGLESILSHSR